SFAALYVDGFGANVVALATNGASQFTITNAAATGFYLDAGGVTKLPQVNTCTGGIKSAADGTLSCIATFPLAFFPSLNVGGGSANTVTLATNSGSQFTITNGSTVDFFGDASGVIKLPSVNTCPGGIKSAADGTLSCISTFPTIFPSLSMVNGGSNTLTMAQSAASIFTITNSTNAVWQMGAGQHIAEKA